MVPMRKAVELLARTRAIPWMEALALTKAAKPLLEWIPALVRQELVPTTFLR
jgi:hypothetical protein